MQTFEGRLRLEALASDRARRYALAAAVGTAAGIFFMGVVFALITAASWVMRHVAS